MDDELECGMVEWYGEMFEVEGVSAVCCVSADMNSKHQGSSHHVKLVV
jgi:hypothetical protein